MGKLLDTEGVRAGLKGGATKNEILQKVWKLISDHDGMVADDPRTKRKLLDKALVGLGLYLTSKPPSGTDNNQNRRAALENLAESIRKEFKTLGLRTLQRDHGYWLERLDPRHRAGHNLRSKYREWSQNNVGTAGESFWDYVDNLESASLDSDEQLKDEYVAYFLGNSKEKRALYKVHAEDGKLKDINNDPVNTGNMTTVHSGNGWGIFIFNHKDELFVSSHKLNEFHHSTLMAGKPVKSAGDMVTGPDGKVKLVTVKSGHYRPKPKHLKAVLLHLQAKNCIDHETMVRPSFSDWSPNQGMGDDDDHVVIYDAAAWLLSDWPPPPELPKSEVMRRLPAHAVNRSSTQRFLNGLYEVKPEDLSRSVDLSGSWEGASYTSPMNPLNYGGMY